MLLLKLSSGLANHIILLQIVLSEEIRHAEVQVPIEVLKVNIYRVRHTSAEICLGPDRQPVFDGKVDGLGNVESKVETLVVCRSPRNDEFALSMNSLD